VGGAEYDCEVLYNDEGVGGGYEVNVNDLTRLVDS
jgi:hypothetical protein